MTQKKKQDDQDAGHQQHPEKPAAAGAGGVHSFLEQDAVQTAVFTRVGNIVLRVLDPFVQIGFHVNSQPPE